MNRQQDFVARVRRRTIEIACGDPEIDLHVAERQAIAELKAIERARELASQPKAKGGGGVARLGAALANIASRMSAAGRRDGPSRLVPSLAR
jgi:hypothetical protein